MRQRSLLAGTILLATWQSGCGIGDAALTARQTQVETRAIEPTGTFQLKNTNGRVEIRAGSERQVRIEAEKMAPSEQVLNELEVAIVAQGNRVEVLTRAPHTPWGFFGSSGRVNYRITLPASVRVDVESTNGSVHVSGVAGAVRVRSVNGSVRVEDAAGEVAAHSVNGSVNVAYSAVPRQGLHRFATTNGSVTVRLPADASGSFQADTVNGGISTDLPLAVQGHFGTKHLRGQLGEGGGRFEISTVNGSVAVKKS